MTARDHACHAIDLALETLGFPSLEGRAGFTWALNSCGLAIKATTEDDPARAVLLRLWDALDYADSPRLKGHETRERADLRLAIRETEELFAHR